MNIPYEYIKATKVPKPTKEERDWEKFCWLAASSKKLTAKESEWVLDQSVKGMARILVYEDCYDRHVNHGESQGRYGFPHYLAMLKKMTMDEQDAELLRLRVKYTTIITPWLLKKQGWL